MATWQYRIQRFDRVRALSRLSRMLLADADDFSAAVRAVELIAAGMRAADPDCEYRIVHPLSHDYRGEDCSGGVRMFETADEARDRLAERAVQS